MLAFDPRGRRVDRDIASVCWRLCAVHRRVSLPASGRHPSAVGHGTGCAQVRRTGCPAQGELPEPYLDPTLGTVLQGRGGAQGGGAGAT